MTDENSKIERSFLFYWPIPFSQLKSHQESNSKIESPTFCTVLNDIEYVWRLRLFPKGDGDDASEKKRMSLFLFYIKGPTDKVLAKFQFLIRDREMFKATEYSFSEQTNGFGVRYFANQDYTKVGTNDRLLLAVQIWLDASCFSIDSLIPPPEKAQENDLGAFLFESVVLDRENGFAKADFCLVPEEGRELYCNRAVLGRISPAFSAMVSHEMKESAENRVKIEDCNGDMLLELLHFAYKGALSDKCTTALIHDILYMAEKYLVADLKTICHRWLLKRYKSSNIVETLNLAITYDLPLMNHVGLYRLAKIINTDVKIDLSDLTSTDVLISLAKRHLRATLLD